TALLLALAPRAWTALSLAGCALMRGRAARPRRPATLRIAGRCVRGRLRSRAPRTWVGAALLIHHRSVRLRAAGTVGDRRALRLLEPRRARRRRRVLKMLRVVGSRQSAAGRRSRRRAASCRPAPSARAASAPE